MKKVCFFVFIGIFNWGISQDLTGKWVEIWHEDAINAYAELNIESHSGRQISGYTFDVTKEALSKYNPEYIIDEGRCSYKFKGEFNAANQSLILSDYYQIFRTTNHVPGKYYLRYIKENGEEFLEGTIVLGSLDFEFSRTLHGSVVARFKKVPENYIIEDPMFADVKYEPPVEDYLNEDRFYEPYYSEEELMRLENNAPLTKTTDDLPQVIDVPIEVTPETLSQNNTIEVVPEPLPPTEENLPLPIPIEEEEAPLIVESIPVETEIITEAVEMPEPKDMEFIQPPLTEEEIQAVEAKYATRETKTLANIQTNDQQLKIVVKDYGEQDGDLISIIVDGKVLFRNLPITTLSQTVIIDLVTQKKQNEVIFVAENLGRVPPNTARIEMHLNNKKYSYSLLTDTKTNAKIVLIRD